MLLLLWACQSGEATQAIMLYRNGLENGDCGQVPDPRLRDDCFLVTATRKELRTGPCDQIVDTDLESECFFLLAEREKDSSLCQKAGRFRDSCSLHVLSMGLDQWIPKDATPASLEGSTEVNATLLREIKKSGLRTDDPRPWSAIYRWVLGQHRPLDRSSCAPIPDNLRRQACEKTGIAVYNDLLNNARDSKLYPCDKVPAGQPPGSLPVAELPLLLQYTPDPELDQLRLTRQDLCP